MEVTPWELKWQGNILFPVDDELHAAAVKFCSENLVAPLDPRLFAKLWVAREEGKVLGVTGIQSRWDIPLFRAIDKRAGFSMANRINSYLADAGLRGQEVLLFLSDKESPEQQCPNREDILQRWGAQPAERYLISCR